MNKAVKQAIESLSMFQLERLLWRRPEDGPSTTEELRAVAVELYRLGGLKYEAIKAAKKLPYAAGIYTRPK
jgi:hypothetical protein